MRNCIIIFLIFLLVSPPMQAHVDFVVTDKEVTHYELEELSGAHADVHHQNDSKEHKDKEHHHHCVIISNVNFFITNDFNYLFTKFPYQKGKIYFSKNLYSTYSLDKLFQPPKFC